MTQDAVAVVEDRHLAMLLRVDWFVHRKRLECRQYRSAFDVLAFDANVRRVASAVEQGMVTPRVTIGVPVFNGESYLAEMLDSVLCQTFADFEIVVSDNASTDSTADILQSYARQDHRIRVSSETANRGAGWNFNRVLELASGNYFKWQAHDDLLTPDYLQKCVAELESDPGAVLAHTGVEMVDADLNHIEQYGIRLETDHPDRMVRFREMVLPWNLCFEVFGIIRLDALRNTAGMGNFSHGDGVLLAHLALLGKFAFVDEPLFISRQHPEQSNKQFGFDGGGNDYQSYAAWFDPNLKDKIQFPNWRILLEFQRVVHRVRDLTMRERLVAQWILLRRARQDVRNLVGDAVQAGQTWRCRRSGSFNR